MTDYRITTALAAIDWDFPSRVAHSAIEGLHPYPAKFIAEIPGALLDVLPISAGSVVLDPFCGSGTTLVESQRRGIPSIGIDLNPIAALITRVKTSPMPAGMGWAAEQAIEQARHSSPVDIPDIPNLAHWFKPPVQSALAACTAAISSAHPDYHDILRLALSSIIVRVSNQDSDTRYAAVQKSVSGEDVFCEFATAAHRIITALDARGYDLESAAVINYDTLAVMPSSIARPVGVVITSPPYPNAYEYWLYHKYRMWWLGFDPLAIKHREIGARAHFFKRNHHTAEHFRQQMTATFNLLRKVVVPGGFACFVIGRSKIHGRIVDNAAIIEDVANAAGFVPVFQSERAISAQRKSFNLTHARIKTENLLVLRYAGQEKGYDAEMA